MTMQNQATCQEALRLWLQSTCPTFWDLLKGKAKRCVPNGIEQYIKNDDGTESKIGKHHLEISEKSLRSLIECCGVRQVHHAYRRDLSGLTTAKQLSELLCEITLCSNLSGVSKITGLRPSTGHGKFCDVSFRLAGFDIYGEAKRYDDSWPSMQGGAITRPIRIEEPRSSADETARPRHMDLQSKLHEVPSQFPEGTMNILFLFHSSIGESARYISQALFGGHTFFAESNNPELREDGLFTLQQWHVVSACCFTRIEVDGSLSCIDIWKNPRATVPVPTQVYAVFDSLKPKFDGEYQRVLMGLLSS